MPLAAQEPAPVRPYIPPPPPAPTPVPAPVAAPLAAPTPPPAAEPVPLDIKPLPAPWATAIPSAVEGPAPWATAIPSAVEGPAPGAVASAPGYCRAGPAAPSAVSIPASTGACPCAAASVVPPAPVDPNAPLPSPTTARRPRRSPPRNRARSVAACLRPWPPRCRRQLRPPAAAPCSPHRRLGPGPRRAGGCRVRPPRLPVGRPRTSRPGPARHRPTTALFTAPPPRRPAAYLPVTPDAFAGFGQAYGREESPPHDSLGNLPGPPHRAWASSCSASRGHRLAARRTSRASRSGHPSRPALRETVALRRPVFRSDDALPQGRRSWLLGRPLHAARACQSRGRRLLRENTRRRQATKWGRASTDGSKRLSLRDRARRGAGARPPPLDARVRMPGDLVGAELAARRRVPPLPDSGEGLGRRPAARRGDLASTAVATARWARGHDGARLLRRRRGDTHRRRGRLGVDREPAPAPPLPAAGSPPGRLAVRAPTREVSR